MPFACKTKPCLCIVCVCASCAASPYPAATDKWDLALPLKQTYNWKYNLENVGMKKRRNDSFLSGVIVNR